ncbi:MAG: putative lipid II flippase FtsW [Acidimicrobiia bacterium]|nr:putative lipid II flippase FtsW [Acidimicrobiia bacterium]
MATRVTPITRARSVGEAIATHTANERTTVFLLLPVAILLIVGLGALMSASSVIGLAENGDKLHYVKRQAGYIGGGLVVFLVTMRVPYRWYARLALPILVLAIGGLVVTLGMGEVRNGARRWIDLGSFSLQPSEFAKFAVVVFVANAMARKEKWLHQFAHVFWPVAGSLGVVAGLLLLQPDLGTTLIVASATFAVLAASMTPIRHVLAFVAMGAMGVGVLARTNPYQWERVTSFLDPEADPLGNGLQAIQSLVALGTGGLFGVGLGASRARWFFLPNAHTDFIFSIIGEETGLAGSLIVIALLMTFAVMGTVVAMRAPDMFGRLLAVGIVSWLSIQAIINIGGVTRVLPISGVPLPFVSSGGSAMLVNLAVVGVLANIARSGRAGAARKLGAQ